MNFLGLIDYFLTAWKPHVSRFNEIQPATSVKDSIFGPQHADCRGLTLLRPGGLALRGDTFAGAIFGLGIRRGTVVCLLSCGVAPRPTAGVAHYVGEFAPHHDVRLWIEIGGKLVWLARGFLPHSGHGIALDTAVCRVFLAAGGGDLGRFVSQLSSANRETFLGRIGGTQKTTNRTKSTNG